uniref:Pentatricopeptide repeat-containing protein n=1 Tax=Kalanchoe fedtschenkoi TaxID=63787 RepID=A0A7N0U7D8_KALFE
MALRSYFLAGKALYATLLAPKRMGFSGFHYLSRSAANFPEKVTSSTSARLANSESFNRLFSSASSKVNNFRTNFSLPSDSESDDEGSTKPAPKEVEKAKLPPPYDPFSKKPVIEEPEDPKNLQEIFHNMRSEGLMQSAVKMFDGLSKEGLTHEALRLFSEIKDKGSMPDVIAHTAVMEAYANAGESKQAHKVYLRMLTAGVLPNAYTYFVLIKGLSKDKKKLGDARKYLVEMMGKGMRPNAETYAAVAEGFVREGMESECRSMVEEMKGKGYVTDEKAVREALSSKRGPVFRTVMEICFAK